MAEHTPSDTQLMDHPATAMDTTNNQATPPLDPVPEDSEDLVSDPGQAPAGPDTRFTVRIPSQVTYANALSRELLTAWVKLPGS